MSVRTALVCLLAVASATFVGFAPASVAQEFSQFKLVVHQDNPASAIDSSTVKRIFMKKKSSWDDWDQSILPIDRNADSSLREVFSDVIHGKSLNALDSYWQRMIFSGRSVPPDVLGADQALFEYIQSHPGAVSYVEADTELPEGIKELEIADE